MIQQIELRADLENIASLSLPPTHDWFLKIACKSCREEFPNIVSINATEQVEIPGSRGTANLVIRCKSCKHEHNMSIVEKSMLSAYTDEDAGSFKPLIQIESRGLEIVEWEIRDGFQVKTSEGSKTFDNVDLHEKEWYDYDDVAQTAVSITNVEIQIKIKK